MKFEHRWRPTKVGEAREEQVICDICGKYGSESEHSCIRRPFYDQDVLDLTNWLARHPDDPKLGRAFIVNLVDSHEYWRAKASEWERRAKAHGCDTERGDPDCG